MSSISVVVITRNEESRIGTALRSVRPFVDEIVVVDDMSTDRTGELAARDFGAKVLSRRLTGDFAAQRNAGADSASGEWILQMDADEVFPETTMQKIKELTAEGRYDGFAFRRLNHFVGRPLRYCARDGGMLRLYRKGRGRYEEAVHERLKLDGAALDVDLEVWHFPAERVEELVLKGLRYTETEADLYCREHATVCERDIFRELTWKSLKRFWKLYVRKQGYRDGTAGLVWCVLNTIGPQLRWMKIWEQADRAGKLER
ncbi:MAG: glycosyltransferase family 2 protein [Candidatus Omnitrophica bacterium]|nr:glycosyltransferase family 2 protein [Candidatus Omnitrophota bacterium]